MLTGDFTYEFAVAPFAGEWRQAELHRHALAYNFPVVCASGQPGAGKLGDTVQPLGLGSENILLSALYPENGQVYARLFDYSGQSGETSINCPHGQPRLQTTDLLGHGEQRASNPIALQA